MAKDRKNVVPLTEVGKVEPQPPAPVKVESGHPVGAFVAVSADDLATILQVAKAVEDGSNRLGQLRTDYLLQEKQRFEEISKAREKLLELVNTIGAKLKLDLVNESWKFDASMSVFVRMR